MSSEVCSNKKDKVIFQDVIKITEENFEIYDRAESILGTGYMNCTDDDSFKGYIDKEAIEELIEDLCSEIDRLKERIEELEDPPMNDLSYPGEEYDREQYYEWKYGSQD